MKLKCHVLALKALKAYPNQTQQPQFKELVKLFIILEVEILWDKVLYKNLKNVASNCNSSL